MIVNRRGSVWGLLRWQWKSALIFAGTAALVYALERLHLLPTAFPALPLAVLGGALGIFSSFRSNSAYARWWEGRQLWGRLINLSRHLAHQAGAYLPPAAAAALLHRQIAYVHLLRCLLREQDWKQDEDILRTLPEAERQALIGQQNPTAALLAKQLPELKQLQREGLLESLELQSFDVTLNGIIDVQGGCERIKRTPMPPAYGFVATRLTQLFSVMLPMVLVHEIGPAVIPLNVLVCLSFTLINEAGRVLEDPFTMYWNGLPLSAMSRTIEVNLRQVLGESDVPEIPQAVPPGILM